MLLPPARNSVPLEIRASVPVVLPPTVTSTTFWVCTVWEADTVIVAPALLVPCDRVIPLPPAGTNGAPVSPVAPEVFPMFERPAEKPAPAEIVTEAPAELFD